MKGNEQKKKNTSERKQSGVTVKNTKRTKEIAAVILFAFGVFLFFSFIGKTGALGRFVAGIMYGLFGQLVSYVIMCFLVVLAWTLLRNTAGRIFDIKTSALLIAFIILLGALIHTIFHSPSEYKGLDFFEGVAALWSNKYSGGLLGGSICLLLFKFVEKVGALVILIPATLIVAMLLFSLSLMNFAQKTAVGFSHVSDWLSNVRRRFAASRKEKKVKREAYIADNIYDEQDDDNGDYSAPAYRDEIAFESAATRKKKRTVFKDETTTYGAPDNNTDTEDEDIPDETVKAEALPGLDKTVKTKVPADNEIKITTSKNEVEYVKPPITLLESVEESESTGTEYKLQQQKQHVSLKKL